MKRIINTVTLETVWRGTDYLVDGITTTVERPLYLLTDTTRPAPAYDAATHRLQSISAHADLDSSEWVTSSYEIVALTSDEIAENAIIAARKIWPNAAAFLSEFTMSELAATLPQPRSHHRRAPPPPRLMARRCLERRSAHHYGPRCSGDSRDHHRGASWRDRRQVIFP